MADVPILAFQGEHRFLSNFWPTPWVEWEGLVFPTVEHAYQAAKTVNASERYQILQAETAGRAKSMGRRVTIRPDWDAEKLTVMLVLLRQKFAEKNLRGMLLRTGTAPLYEGNTWGDTFWGICNGRGENHLGRLLMQVREEVR